MSEDSNTTKIEKAIVTALVEELGKSGFKPFQVWDGGEYVACTDVASVLNAVFAVDTATVHFKPGDYGVFLVCGNGEDVISDYHCGNKTFTAAVERASERASHITVTC